MSRRICRFACRPMSACFLLGVMLGLNPSYAEAGPCSANIAQFETAIRQSAGNP
jgi:hypothetical protein